MSWHFQLNLRFLAVLDYGLMHHLFIKIFSNKLKYSWSTEGLNIPFSPVITCSNLTIEILEQGMKNVQN